MAGGLPLLMALVDVMALMDGRNGDGGADAAARGGAVVDADGVVAVAA